MATIKLPKPPPQGNFFDPAFFEKWKNRLEDELSRLSDENERLQDELESKGGEIDTSGFEKKISETLAVALRAPTVNFNLDSAWLNKHVTYIALGYSGETITIDATTSTSTNIGEDGDRILLPGGSSIEEILVRGWQASNTNQKFTYNAGLHQRVVTIRKLSGKWILTNEFDG